MESLILFIVFLAWIIILLAWIMVGSYFIDKAKSSVIKKVIIFLIVLIGVFVILGQGIYWIEKF